MSVTINEPFFNKLLIFCIHDLIEAPCGDVNGLFKGQFFPLVEASQELVQSLSSILKRNIKSVYDSYRRAIEFVIAVAFFVSEYTVPSKAKALMKSYKSTPGFRRACEELVMNGHFERLKYD